MEKIVIMLAFLCGFAFAEEVLELQKQIEVRDYMPKARKKQRGFFIGIGGAKMTDSYFYESLEIKQFLGTQNAGQIINPPPLNSKECPAWFILENLDAFLTGNQASVNGIQVGVNPAVPPTPAFMVGSFTIIPAKPGKPETPILSNCTNVKPQANTVAVNQYIDISVKQQTSFSNPNSFKNYSPVLNFGYKFNFWNFFYTPEFFINKSNSRVKHLTFVPGQQFAGIASIDTGIIGIQESVVITEIPEVSQVVTYSMPLNAGMISRMGYDFEMFSLSLISGGTLTILDIADSNTKERVYQGRFLAGIGFEMNFSRAGNFTLYTDYKYYIPISKDIEREYEDKENIGEKVKVKIKNFKAQTQSFEMGIKYYF
jgi:hypothetical protein